MNEEDDFENKKEENKGIRRKLLGHLYYKSLKRQFRVEDFPSDRCS